MSTEYVQSAVVGCVQRYEELRKISDKYYKTLGKSIQNNADIDYVARIMYTKHILPNPFWLSVYLENHYNQYAVHTDSPELIELTAFIKKCGGWVKFVRVLQHYAKRRLLSIMRLRPGDYPTIESAKKFVEKIDAIPKDGRYH